MKNPAKFFELYDEYCNCAAAHELSGYGLMTEQEYAEFKSHEEEAEAEMYAESAWLRHAERTTYEDMAFEKYEHERMYT
jgi:hypothetical protein